MKRCFFFVAFLSYTVLSLLAGEGEDSLLVRLDKVLDEQGIYMQQKENRIDSLKHLLKEKGLTQEQRFLLNRKLGEEYELYVSDSALKYLDKSLAIAERLPDKSWIDATNLQLTSAYSVSGMYKEALETLHSIDRNALPDSLLAEWYNCGRQLNSFLSTYSHNAAYTQLYAERERAYRDSLLTVLPPGSPAYRLYEAEQWVGTGRYNQAKKALLSLLADLPERSNIYGRAAFSLASIYKEEGQMQKYEDYLALSAISDVKGAVKENAALQFLALALYEQGKIDRAYRYIKYSLEDAIFCNARLRTIEVSGILPVIDAAYKLKTEEQRKQLLFFLILVSVLSLFLIVAVLLVYKQMKKVSLTQQNLRQANHIKEEYIGHFLNLCSIYIEKLDNFRRTVNRKLVAGQTEELLKLTKSSQFAGNEQKEFYANFDNAFLHLYPDFVAEFNQLLQPEERFVLKQGELLNTELRIFAFIRLGIDDSSKIANFLHYSINTIYTYRNKVKNKAVDREKFEEEILKIGSVAG